MDKKQVNKFLTEYIGECWHEWEFRSTEYEMSRKPWECTRCGITAWNLDAFSKTTFFTWPGFGKLKEFMEKERPEEWTKFINWHLGGKTFKQYVTPVYEMPIVLVDPGTLAEELARFLDWKEEKPND